MDSTAIGRMFQVLGDRQRRTRSTFERIARQLQQIGIKENEKRIVNKLKGLSNLTDKHDVDDCINFVDFILQILPPLVPITPWDSFLYVKNAAESSLTHPEDIWPKGKVEIITRWLPVYYKVIDVLKVLMTRANDKRVRDMTQKDYCSYFFVCVIDLRKVFEFEKWNFVDNAVKKNYEDKLISFIGDVISKVPRLGEADLLPNYSKLTCPLAMILKNLDYQEVNAPKVILILRAIFELLQSCFEKIRFNRYLSSLSEREKSNLEWKKNRLTNLVDNLKPFLPCFQYKNREVRFLVANICFFMTENFSVIDVHSLVFPTILKLSEESDRVIGTLVTRATRNIKEAVAQSIFVSMDKFSIQSLRNNLSSLLGTTQPDTRDLLTAIKYITALFNYPEVNAHTILCYKKDLEVPKDKPREKTQAERMLDSFFSCVEMDENEKAEWLPRPRSEDDFLHFGSKRNLSLCVSLPFKLNTDDVKFISDNIVSWLVILATSNSDSNKVGIIQLLMLEHLNCRESFFLLVQTLKSLLTKKVRREKFWASCSPSRDNLEKDLRNCLVDLNKALGNSLPVVSHHCLTPSESQSLARIEPDRKRYTFHIEITCLALTGIQLIAQILGFNHKLERNVIASITQNVLFKCRHIDFMISLNANRCLQQIATYWLKNLQIEFHEGLDFLKEEWRDKLEDFGLLRELRDDCSGNLTCRIWNILIFFRTFSSVSFCTENGNELWKIGHPAFFRYLISEIEFIKEKNNYQGYEDSLAYNLFLEVLATYGGKIGEVGIVDEDIERLCVALKSCLSSHLSKIIKKLADKMHNALSGVNKDLVTRLGWEA